MRFPRRFTCCALLLCLAIPPSPSGAVQPRQVTEFSAIDFPHPAVYLYLSGDGHQLNSDASVANIARFSLAVIHASPATEDYSARLRQIRALNPNIILLAYFPGDFMWPLSTAKPGSIFGDAWKAYDANDWWLYDVDGSPFEFFGNTVDLVHPAATDWMASFIYDRVLSTGLWDGVFLDDFCESNYWKEAFNGQEIDENRDGLADDQAVLDPLWKAATDSLASKLRARMGPDMLMVGNCGYGSKWTTMNGWMREDFPFQGTWWTNMFATQGGYMTNEKQYRSPQVDLVYSTSLPPPNQYTPGNLQFMRYCLSSTLLGNGFFMFDPRLDTLNTSQWWFDEYDAGGLGTGYLGQPAGAWYQQIGALTTPDLFTNTGFESGLAGWTAYNTAGSIVIDTTTRVQGRASAHAIIQRATDYYSQVYLSQQPSLLARGYSVTFWARAAQARHIWLTAQKVASPYTIFAYTQLDVGPAWKRYQVTVPVSSAGLVNVFLQMGKELGDVWLDDVHLQQGASSLYRRDFDRGMVLVNASGTAITTTLEKPFYHFWGAQNPTLNNGTAVSQITLAPQDGAILLTDPPPVVVGVRGGEPATAKGGLRLAALQTPARGEARFEITLDRAAAVDLELYSVTGRHVATLHDGFLGAGRHDFAWKPGTGHGAGAGIFFARARAHFPGGTATATARIALLR